MADESDPTEGARLSRRECARLGLSRRRRAASERLRPTHVRPPSGYLEGRIPLVGQWPRDVGKEGLWDVPLRQISFRTSSSEIRRILTADLDDGFEQWTDEPSATGVDKAGRTFQERIEVTLEDDGPEWDEEEAEPDFWRARGKACVD
jgi:hypothetical protein